MAQSRPKTTTDPIAALGRKITSLGRRVRDLELRPDPASGGGGTSLRATWCGGFGTQADFVGGSSDLLVTFEGPSTVEQSGGFVFSDHPSAQGIDWSGPTVVAAQHSDHRIAVPVAGVYTIVLNYALRALFPINIDYVELRTTVEPDGIKQNSWFWGHLGAGNPTSGQFASAAFTVELAPGTPFWIEVTPFGKLFDGTTVTNEETWISDASITVEG